jgi:hypothetical protein
MERSSWRVRSAQPWSDRAAAPTIHSLGGGFMARLWKRRPELFFTGRIHERVGACVSGLVLAHHEEFQILHLGYDPELDRTRDKRARNKRLLERALDEQPLDPVLRYHFALELYAAADFRGALEKLFPIIEEGTIINYVLTPYVFATERLRILGEPNAHSRSRSKDRSAPKATASCGTRPAERRYRQASPQTPNIASPRQGASTPEARSVSFGIHRSHRAPLDEIAAGLVWRVASTEQRLLPQPLEDPHGLLIDRCADDLEFGLGHRQRRVEVKRGKVDAAVFVFAG